mmetsp:Transcript_13864/g.21055  ORF Transcript_13864/g.21055 Transcript_13864/m.21055 type:complete len:127 (+) Transcript_13864:2136-2516(+)
MDNISHLYLVFMQYNGSSLCCTYLSNTLSLFLFIIHIVAFILETMSASSSTPPQQQSLSVPSLQYQNVYLEARQPTSALVPYFCEYSPYPPASPHGVAPISYSYSARLAATLPVHLYSTPPSALHY